MELIDRLRAAASALSATVVFPDADDPRVVAAAYELLRCAIATPLLVGEEAAVRAAAERAGLAWSDEVLVLDPRTHPLRGAFAEQLPGVWRGKPLAAGEAATLMGEPLAFAAMLVRMGLAEACVAGAASPTRRVIRTALDVIGLADGALLASSVFLMVLPDGRPVTFGDCAVVPNPTAEQLADIALNAAATHQRLTGCTPYVALLSFSTKGSAEHESVARVREATRIAQAAGAGLAIDGELQVDAALVPEVGQAKAKGSAVAGRANVLVFPNLDAGNIGYKLVERLAGARAIGPILQGLARPMHDLSRGCRVEDVVTLAAVAVLQAAAPAAAVSGDSRAQ
jgi:phosphate acetyltransferase